MKQAKRQPFEIARRIVVDPRVRFGQPVINGTRVPVPVLLDQLAAGTTSDVIADEYAVTQEDIRAAIRFAAQLVATEAIFSSWSRVASAVLGPSPSFRALCSSPP